MGRVHPEGALVKGEKNLGCLPLHCLPAVLNLQNLEPIAFAGILRDGAF